VERKNTRKKKYEAPTVTKMVAEQSKFPLREEPPRVTAGLKTRKEKQKRTKPKTGSC